MQGVLIHMSYRWESTGNAIAYESHLFGRLCASQKVTKIESTIFPLLDAVRDIISYCMLLRQDAV